MHTHTYLGEVGNHLLDQGPHWSHIDDFKLVHVDGAITVHVLVYLPQNAEQSHVGLTSTLHGETDREADRHRLGGMHGVPQVDNDIEQPITGCTNCSYYV